MIECTASITLLPVESSTIAEIGYSPVLRIRFKSGGTYDYYGVPLHIFQGFLDSNSKGKFFYNNIKFYFPCKRVEDDSYFAIEGGNGA